MKLLTVQGEALVNIALAGGKDEPLAATIDAGPIYLETSSEVKMEKVGEALIAHIRVPGKVKFDVMLERGDIGALKGMMSGDVIKFMIAALMKG